MKDSIEHFAAAHAERLSKRFQKEVGRSAEDPAEDQIHDLRVSIRRLSQCLSEFRQFLPSKKTKRTRKRLKRLMDAAAEIRNRDIAIALVRKQSPKLAATLGREREEFKRGLTKALRRWGRDDAH